MHHSSSRPPLHGASSSQSSQPVAASTASLAPCREQMNAAPLAALRPSLLAPNRSPTLMPVTVKMIADVVGADDKLELVVNNTILSTTPTIGTPISRAVMDAVIRLSSSGSVGANINDIGALLFTTASAVRPFLVDLASVGEVYMTIDDDHFKET
ncbi:hypothetical protein ZWY2020_054599 [Hordeum vulgare]|nr:hypothetical protein ZWY2020_054599 [Hordeum vulgare]